MEVALVFFALALVVGGYHQFTLRKKDFLAAVILLLIGSWTEIIIGPQNAERIFFVGAITFSFFGDLAMASMLKVTGRRVIDGIVFFAIAHLFYLGGILAMTTIKWEFTAPLAMTIAVIGYWKTAYNPNKPVLSGAAAIYAVLISTLFAAIAIRATFDPKLQTIVALIGIGLFVGSDMMIAYREFKRDFIHSERWISATYVLGQCLLLSTMFLIGV